MEGENAKEDGMASGSHPTDYRTSLTPAGSFEGDMVERQGPAMDLRPAL
jgi:hypothetical protein